MAYQLGIFPWYNEDDPILWYAPHERCVIFPGSLKVSKNMQRLVRSRKWSCTKNRDFNAVVNACASVPRKGQDGTWIHQDMREAYGSLHEAGWAHSYEVWDEERLIGGLYGLQIGSVFCGESMFSIESNASKVALYQLAQETSIELIDCQLPNDHLMRQGAEMIPMKRYQEFLKKANSTVL